jgi:2-polyprenyl-3-methyl-5-hydroxy-6-metoxy-1,4-benzoquinol methylase
MATADLLTGLQKRAGCPLCKTREGSVFLAFPEIQIIRCASCEFMYSSAVLSEERLTEFYTEQYGGDRHMQGQRVNAAINFRAIRRLLRSADLGRVLEVGSGYGFLLKLLQDRLGADVTGVELSKEEAEHAQEQLGVRTYMSLDAAPLRGASFDTVACFEVIEHVLDPVGFLNGLAHLVRPGGCLLVMTDNFESAVVRRLGADFPKWIPHQHVSHFSQKTLRASIANVPGMKVESELSYTPWELHARWLTRLGKDRRHPAAFDLTSELSTQMTRPYQLFGLRRSCNQLWAALTFRTDLRGALMYVAARRMPS